MLVSKLSFNLVSSFSLFLAVPRRFAILTRICSHVHTLSLSLPPSPLSDHRSPSPFLAHRIFLPCFFPRAQTYGFVVFIFFFSLIILEIHLSLPLSLSLLPISPSHTLTRRGTVLASRVAYLSNSMICSCNCVCVCCVCVLCVSSFRVGACPRSVSVYMHVIIFLLFI